MATVDVWLELPWPDGYDRTWCPSCDSIGRVPHGANLHVVCGRCCGYGYTYERRVT